MTPEERAKDVVTRTMATSPIHDEAGLVNQICDQIEEALRALLALVGGPGQCKGCGAPIYWVKHVGKVEPVPYSHRGINHFIDCSKREQFRKRKSEPVVKGDTSDE